MVLCSGRVSSLSSCFGPASCSYGSSSGFFCSSNLATTKSCNWILRSSASKSRHSSQSNLCRQQMCVFVLWCQYNPSKTVCLGNGTTKKEKNLVRCERSDSMRAKKPASFRPRNQKNGDSDVSQEGNNIWDSNAENVWQRRTYSKDFSRQSDKSSKIPPQWTQFRKQWDYDSEDKTSDSRWQWWQSTKDGDEYDYESEDEEEDSAPDFDIKSILQEQGFSLLRWGLPFMLLVLPWLLGNPLVLMVGLAAIPAVQKAIVPVVDQVWRGFLDAAGYSVQPKSRRKPPSNRQVDFEEKGERFAGWGSGVDDGRPKPGINGSSMTQGDIHYSEDVPYQRTDVDSDRFSQDSGAWSPAVTSGGRQVNEVGRAGEMRGWDELTADRSRMPSQRAVKPIRLGRKRTRKEKPLVFRLILALFPFLKGWSGWLSVVIFLPMLDSFWESVSV
ncbi:unnamed protein product [Sphagnum jensenii]|uniref:Uncharacterized protein n=1 Tax=Sphagnum jensenii TaxID=128206 RepID=A0ABP0XA79_9BRYO